MVVIWVRSIVRDDGEKSSVVIGGARMTLHRYNRLGVMPS